MYDRVLREPHYYKVGMYIRLSQEDTDKKYESDSESVLNQRTIITNYIETNGFVLVKEYVDDGYSGTNFERPAFQELLNDISKGIINCVITKDLSRLGRDHIMTGYYTETYFNENNVRYIAIYDNIDTFKSYGTSNDFMALRSVMNDVYSRDNSIKIRGSLSSMRKEGKFVGSSPCFGYMRDPNDKNHLVPDPKTAPVVKKIFEMFSSGIGVSDICSYLTENEIPTPSAYKNLKKSSRLKNNDKWTISSIRKILKNRMYVGDMVQGKQAKVSYKSEKKVALDESQWTIVLNTHEPLVERLVWESLQNRTVKSRKINKNRERRIFEELLVCKECGNKLGVVYRKNKDYWTVNCNRYSRDPRRLFCSPHFFPYEYLEEQLLEKIRDGLTDYMNMLDIDYLNDSLTKQQNNTYLYDKKELLIKKKEKLQNQLVKIYEDKLEGIVSVEMYTTMASKIEPEIASVEKEIENLKTISTNIEDVKKVVPDYKEKIKRLLDLNNPTRELISTVIDKIVIDEKSEIVIYFKYGIIEPIKFKYIKPTKPRNPYGRKGKTSSK